MSRREKQYQDIKRKIERLDEQIQLLNARKLILSDQIRQIEIAQQREAERASKPDSSEETR